MGLKGKRVLITGGGRGIGRAIALACAGAGAHVIVAARNRKEIESVASKAMGEAIPLDLTVPHSIRRCIRQAGRVDILINNAAAFAHAEVVKFKLEDWDRVLDTNLRGPFLLCQAALPQMIERREGDIVLISSTSGKRSNPESSAYAASKHGLNGFAQALLYEVRKHNIRVITVSPSAVDTPERGEMRPHRLQAPDIAEAVVAALTLPNRALVRDVELWATNPDGHQSVGSGR